MATQTLYINSSSGSNGTAGASTKITWPAKLLATNMCLLATMDQTATSAMATPTGWTAAGSFTHPSGGTLNLFTRIADGAETVASAPSLTAVGKLGWIMYQLSGATSIASTGANTGTGTSATTGTVSTTYANQAVWAMTANTAGVSQGFAVGFTGTATFQATGNSTIYVSSKDVASPGPVAAATGSVSPSANWIALELTFNLSNTGANPLGALTGSGQLSAPLYTSSNVTSGTAASAPTYIAGSGVAASGATNWPTVPRPTQTATTGTSDATGQLMVLTLYTITASPTWSVPSGFTKVAEYLDNTGVMGSMAVFTKQGTATEPNNYNSLVGAGVANWSFLLLCYADAQAIDQVVFTPFSTTTGPTWTVPTTSSPNSYLNTVQVASPAAPAFSTTGPGIKGGRQAVRTVGVNSVYTLEANSPTPASITTTLSSPATSTGLASSWSLAPVITTVGAASTFSGGGNLSGSGDLAVGGTPALTGGPSLSGSGALTVNGTPGTGGAPSLSGTGTLTGSGTPDLGATNGLSGSGLLTVTSASQGLLSTYGLSGSGLLTASSLFDVGRVLALSGDGILTALSLLELIQLADLSGEGDLLALGTPLFDQVFELSGSGDLVARGVAHMFATALGLVSFSASLSTRSSAADLQSHATVIAAALRTRATTASLEH